jgi:hypothetical protein
MCTAGVIVVFVKRYFRKHKGPISTLIGGRDVQSQDVIAGVYCCSLPREITLANQDPVTGRVSTALKRVAHWITVGTVVVGIDTQALCDRWAVPGRCDHKTNGLRKTSALADGLVGR